jgi:hypothetical protein
MRVLYAPTRVSASACPLVGGLSIRLFATRLLARPNEIKIAASPGNRFIALARPRYRGRSPGR